MKVVCIDNERFPEIVIGQHYQIRIVHREPINGDFCVIGNTKHQSGIFDDSGNLVWLPSRYFLSIDEWRNKQLNDIL